ncbi:MAG: hypothetical protein WC824_13895, partial [Bacteroidota bacterium]
MNPLGTLVRIAKTNPQLIPQLAPAIRMARELEGEERDAIKMASHHFPVITRGKWANMTCLEKYAVMKRLAHKAILFPQGLTKDAVRQGMGFMVYDIEAGANKSKFYEGLVVPDDGGFRVIRRYGALTDSGQTGKIVGENWDHEEKFVFQTLQQAKRELGIHYATRIAHGYTDAYGPKHVT